MVKNKTCELLSDKGKLVCTKCKVELDISYLGKRCPRCNTVLRAPCCDKCSGCQG